MVTDSVSPNSQGPCFLTQLSPGAHQRWARPLPWGLAPSTAGLWTGRCGAWRCQPRRGESKAGPLLRPGLRHLLEARGRTGGVGRGVPGAPAWRRDKALSHSDRGQTLAPRSPARSHHPPGPSHSPLFTPASASWPVPAPFRIPARAPVRVLSAGVREPEPREEAWRWQGSEGWKGVREREQPAVCMSKALAGGQDAKGPGS